jgi:hypothetical protein
VAAFDIKYSSGAIDSDSGTASCSADFDFIHPLLGSGTYLLRDVMVYDSSDRRRMYRSHHDADLDPPDSGEKIVWNYDPATMADWERDADLNFDFLILTLTKAN